jgi:hypothetical protein
MTTTYTSTSTSSGYSGGVDFARFTTNSTYGYNYGEFRTGFWGSPPKKEVNWKRKITGKD